MPGCVLRISGPYERLRDTIRTAPVHFKESGQSRREREKGTSPADGRCTFNYTVSDADGAHVPLQISDAEIFLSAHGDELRVLLAGDGINDACLDFGWEFPDDSLGQFNKFPHSLLHKCADLRIAIEVSVYHAGKSDGDNVA